MVNFDLIHENIHKIKGINIIHFHINLMIFINHNQFP